MTITIHNNNNVLLLYIIYIYDMYTCILYIIYFFYLHHVFHVITPWLSSFQVEPVAGLALWWPNVHDDLGTDFRTRHEAQTVQQGVKWVANLWLHQYDFRGPYSHLTWMGDEAREELGASWCSCVVLSSMNARIVCRRLEILFGKIACFLLLVEYIQRIKGNTNW